ncbi:MAG TPA: lactonase family protein [Kiritimatiellia bacterium]|jgi:6-phosphogluconolactonase|nr:MAG: 6-phosphogluconolactonase [Verrucomicrobia bacterium ADurb.Bin070]HPB11717.1 lactonase family protein [Kiritimatiellia bacterium]HQA38823.1 lactonase family protein [Kiritimatiellia bacterium]HQL50602.1 lactonase family protein [Kiritimatiellia bacterium]HQQ92115.1 lactonase family protein [Kiritimatiellia bacterium]
MNVLAYIGCYTDEKKTGIHIFDADTESGDFRPVGCVAGIENAIYLTLNKARTRLYAGLGLPALGAPGTNGAVAAYAIQGDTLQPLNHKPIGVTPPCYVALDPAERALVFAEYTNAVSGVFELDADGRLADTPPVTVTHTGSGPDPKRQEKAHAHCAEVSPDGRHLCICDLGIDRVKVYDFPARALGLKEIPALAIASAGGAGPRHLLFHPNRRTAYLLHELNNTISSFLYTGDAFVHVQTITMLPPDFTEYSKASALKLSADGRRLFGSNRGHDSIAAYDIDPETGKMDLLAISRLAGASPRDFEFMPGEKFVLLGHENSNALMSYAYDRATGRLTPAHGPFALYRPVYVKFGAP